MSTSKKIKLADIKIQGFAAIKDKEQQEVKGGIGTWTSGFGIVKSGSGYRCYECS